MPTGIPPSIATFTSSLQEQIITFLTYLQIPSYNDTSTQFQIALSDSIQASKSIYQFLQLTTKPLFIILSLIFKYILIILRILSEHTIYHGIKASKEMWRQSKIAFVWFVDFQKGLSMTAVYMEIGFVGVCIGLYMIRRYLQKKKYVQKLKRWYMMKKNRVLLKYNNFVDSVAQTSQVLALLLPHILYGIITLTLKYFTPSLIRYLANSTILSDVISFYVPIGRTVIVVYKYKNLCNIAEQERMDSLKVIEESKNKRGVGKNNDGERSSIGSKLTSRKGLFSFFSSSNSNSGDGSNTSNKDNKDNNTSDSSPVKKKGKSHIADAYKKAASQGKSASSTITNNKITTKSKTKSYSKVKIIPTILHEDELNDISKEAAELLKYWTVYAILTALIQTATLLPIIGRIFYNANPTNAKKAAASMSRWSRKNQNRVSWLEKIKLSSGLLEECKLFFFAWLRLLPTSMTSTKPNSVIDSKSSASSTKKGASSIASESSIKNRIKALEKQAKYSASTAKSTSIRRKSTTTEAPFSNQPLDIVYNRLAPIVIALVSTSTNFVNESSNSTNSVSEDVTDPIQAFKAKCATFSRTVLEAMVWTKLISGSTKNLIISIFVQCTSILPATVTMFMPSYFTNYGIIYVRLIVPSANSSSSYDAFIALNKKLCSTKGNMMDANGLVDEKWLSASSNINRFLQYWILQAIVSSIVMSFAPVLAWIPLSTHMTWLLWAYIQLESSTKKLYNTLEWDLVAFGVLRQSETMLKVGGNDLGGEAKTIDVNETTSMQLLNSIMKKVPTSLSTTELKTLSETKNNVNNDSDGDSPKDNDDCVTNNEPSTTAEDKDDVKDVSKDKVDLKNDVTVSIDKEKKEVRMEVSKNDDKGDSAKSVAEDSDNAITTTEDEKNSDKDVGESSDTAKDTKDSSVETNENVRKDTSEEKEEKEESEDYVCVPPSESTGETQ